MSTAEELLNGSAVYTESQPVEGQWVPIEWKGLTSFNGSNVWTDGEKIYYSYCNRRKRDSSTNSQYVLNGDTWETKTWSGCQYIVGSCVWTDGTNTYYSDSHYSSGITSGTYYDAQYVLNDGYWQEKSWSGISSQFYGMDVWSDGANVYYSGRTGGADPDSKAYSCIDRVRKDYTTWEEKAWDGITELLGRYVWTDGTNIYYSRYYHNGSRYTYEHYVLNGDTWETKNWNGFSNFSGGDVWTDGENIYCSIGSGSQYVLNGDTWETKMWDGTPSISGGNIWSDGTKLYYSSGSTHYVYTKDVVVGADPIRPTTPVPVPKDPEPHIVVGEDRFIAVPDELKRIAVQYDHNIETVVFDCPRYWDNHDMSEMDIFINYMRSDKAYGCFRAENVTVDKVDSSIMHFTWTISKNATLVKGPLAFLVCVRKSDADDNEVNHWNSELCTDMYVSEGMECAEIILPEYPDIIAQWDSEVHAVMDILLAARDAGELNGATFTPSIDTEGNLSWTNDRGFENPPPVNIRGAAGVNGVVISNTEPGVGSVLWFDTTNGIDGSGVMRYKDADGNLTVMYPATLAKKVSVTLTASGWSEGVYIWSDADIKSADQIIELVPASTITADQLTVLQGANIVGTAQAAGSLTMTAYGEVPTIDIPVVFIIRGDA